MKRIIVDLTAQTLHAFEKSSLFMICDCVSGDSSHGTPRGKFKIIRKQHPYTSHKYKVAMNYAMFFKDTGEAIHQYCGPVPWGLLKAGRAMSDWFGSHGCVRLQESDARKLYSWTPLDTVVEIR